MIHARFDFDQAFESAQRAATDTHTPRYLIQTARGWDIEKTLPTMNNYGFFTFTADGQVLVNEAPVDSTTNKVKLEA